MFSTCFSLHYVVLLGWVPQQFPGRTQWKCSKLQCTQKVLIVWSTGPVQRATVKSPNTRQQLSRLSRREIRDHVAGARGFLNMVKGQPRVNQTLDHPRCGHGRPRGHIQNTTRCGLRGTSWSRRRSVQSRRASGSANDSTCVLWRTHMTKPILQL